MNKSSNIVAYFDFDGTITTKDTLLPFLLHVCGYTRFILYLPFILPIILLYGLKVINNETAKEATLYLLLKGKKESFLEKKAKSFANSLDKYIKPEVFARLEYHLEHHHQVIVVSANLGLYLRFWALRHKITEVIATELKFRRGRFTGFLATPNCYGAEKAKRIKQYLLDKPHFAYSYAYGNSAGDNELLDFVDEAYYVRGTQLEALVKSHLC